MKEENIWPLRLVAPIGYRWHAAQVKVCIFTVVVIRTPQYAPFSMFRVTLQDWLQQMTRKKTDPLANIIYME